MCTCVYGKLWKLLIFHCFLKYIFVFSIPLKVNWKHYLHYTVYEKIVKTRWSKASLHFFSRIKYVANTATSTNDNAIFSFAFQERQIRTSYKCLTNNRFPINWIAPNLKSFVKPTKLPLINLLEMKCSLKSCLKIIRETSLYPFAKVK